MAVVNQWAVHVVLHEIRLLRLHTWSATADWKKAGLSSLFARSPRNRDALWLKSVRKALDRPMDVLGYVNSHYSGYAPGDVERFQRLLNESSE